MLNSGFTQRQINQLFEVFRQIVQEQLSSDKLSEALKCSLVQNSSQLETAVSRGVSGNAEVFSRQLNSLTTILDMHLQVANLRFGLEKSDRGVFDSLKLGLNHLLQQCGRDREYEGLVRKVHSVLNELSILERKAMIDKLITNLSTITKHSNAEGGYPEVIR